MPIHRRDHARRRTAYAAHAARAARRLALAAGAATAWAAAPALAQGPPGVGPDATTLPARALRVGVGIGWDRAAERYEDGVLRGPGDRFSLDTLGVAAFPFLAATESAARVAAGLPEFHASLGTSVVRARDALETTPLSLEYGLASRLSIKVTIPFVTAAARVDATINPLGREATVGLNPAQATPSIAAGYGALLSQLDAAGAYLSARLASCPSNPAAAGCATVLANSGTAQSLVTEAGAFAAALAALYGGRGRDVGALFVPLAGSATQVAIAARLAGIKAQFAAFGAPAVSAAAPLGAPAPLTARDFQGVLGDSAFGIRSTGLQSVVRRGVGNVEVGGTYRWFDSRLAAPVTAADSARWWVRSAFTASYYLGAANPGADALIGAPLGRPAAGARAGVALDVGRGGRFSLSTATTYARWSGASLDVRAPASADDPFPAASRATTIRYTPGAELRLDVAPRVAVSEAIALAATWTWRHRDGDTWAITGAMPSPAPAAVNVSPGMNAVGASSGEHRLGASIGYSTVAAWRRGEARWPLEILLTHYQVTTASGGTVPKISHDDVVLRWYWRARAPLAAASRR